MTEYLGEIDYAWSTDERQYVGSFATRDGALADAALSAKVGQVVWTGVQVPFVPAIAAADIFESLWIEAVDQVGEYAEGWLEHITADEQAELSAAVTDAFRGWAAKHGHTPTFFGITDVERHVIASSNRNETATPENDEGRPENAAAQPMDHQRLSHNV